MSTVILETFIFEKCQIPVSILIKHQQLLAKIKFLVVQHISHMAFNKSLVSNKVDCPQILLHNNWGVKVASEQNPNSYNKKSFCFLFSFSYDFLGLRKVGFTISDLFLYKRFLCVFFCLSLELLELICLNFDDFSLWCSLDFSCRV